MNTRDKLIGLLCLINSLFWALLSIVLCFHYNTFAFMWVGLMAIGTTIIIVVVTEKDYTDYIDCSSNTGKVTE